GQLGFSEEHAAAVLVGGHVGQHQLESLPAAGPLVADQVDSAHAAAAQLLDEVVAVQRPQPVDAGAGAGEQVAGDLQGVGVAGSADEVAGPAGAALLGHVPATERAAPAPGRRRLGAEGRGGHPGAVFAANDPGSAFGERFVVLGDLTPAVGAHGGDEDG